MKFFKKYYLVLPPVALIYGIYILNIKYDLYRDKKIIVKSVNTSNSIIMDSNSEVNKVRKDEY